jgi:hypothetical protein
MNRLPTGWLTLVFTSLCLAQDPATPTPQPGNPSADQLAASKAKVHTALEKTAAVTDLAFKAKWAQDAKKKNDANAFVLGMPSEGSVTGTSHPGLRTCTFENDNGDELVVAGPRTIARDGTNGWTLRAGRFADGNTIDFLPDAALLLDQLAAWDLAVVHREVGSLDDRPVEIVTVTLTADQVAQAVYGGAVPSALANSAFGGMVFQMVGGAGARPAPQAFDATLDLAITFDPATSLVQQIKFRSWMKDEGGARVFRAGGGAIAVRAVAGVQVGGAGGAGGGEDEDEEEKPEAKKDGPMQYEGGLPVRPRKKTTVYDYTVRFSEVGTAKPPVLTDAQKKLLRL